MKKLKLLIKFENLDEVMSQIGYFSNDKKFAEDCYDYSGRPQIVNEKNKKNVFVTNFCRWRNFEKYNLFTNGYDVEAIYKFVAQKQKKKGLPISKFNELFTWPDETTKKKDEELVLWQ